MPDRSVKYTFTGNFANLTAGLTAAGRNVAELGTKMTALDRSGAKMRAGLTTIGSAAGKMGLVAGAGLAVVVGVAARFDKAMSAVQAATHETAGNMKELRDAAIKAGADTVYSASEAANAIEELAKAGVSTKDVLAGGLKGALNLAAAGSIDVADAASIAATAMTQFKLSGNDIPHVADELSAAAGKAQGGVSDMGMALKQSGLVAAQFGVSLDDTVGTLAAFASAGLLGSDAGTSFKQLLLSLANPSTKAANAMQALGISAYDAQGKFVGLTDLAGQLKAALQDKTQADRDSALATIFGSDAIRSANVLYTQGATGIQGWIDKTNDAGYAADTASTRMNNLSGDLEQLKGSLETALIGAGEGSQGPLRQLAQGATQSVNALNTIPGPAKTVATALLGITAVTGGGLWFSSKVIGGITSAKASLAALGIEAETTRAKLALVGTGGAAAALGIGTLLDTLSKMDSMSRSGAAADATVKSFQDLSDTLSYSNVGKYADDLHINLGRLTQDLYENGTQGEYASRILDELGASQHGFGAAIKGFAGEDLPFYTGSTLKAESAQKDLKSIIEQSSDVLGTGAKKATEAGGAVGDYGVKARTSAEATDQLNSAIRKSRQDATKQASAFITLGASLNNAKVSLSDWIKDMRKQADALRDFRINAQQAAKKGLDDGLIASLQKAGPEGALRMKQLANATKDEIGKANGAWRSGQREINRYTDAVGGVPSTAGTTVTVRTFDALTAIARLRNALAQVHSKDVNVNVHYANIANATGGKINRAGGGPIYGPGTKTSDSVPVMASQGEFMMSAAAVDHYGIDTMFRMNARHLASGGPVSGMQANFSSGEQWARPNSVAAAVTEIVQIRHSIREWNAAVRDSQKAIKSETRERDRNQAEVDRLTGLYNSLSSSIQAGLAANQFDQGSAWKSGGGIAGILGKLTTSTTNANAMTAATKALSGSLTGAALQSVLEQGLSTTQMFAGLSGTDLKAYQKAFDANAKALAKAGSAGGNAVYGRDMEKAEQLLAASQAELRIQTHQNAVAERQRDHEAKILTQMKNLLGDLKSEAKKNRSEAHSGARSKR